MGNYFGYYCTLLSSPAQLDTCCEAQSLHDLLACIKTLWNCHHLSDDELLSEISQLNRTPLAAGEVSLVGVWLPYRYQPQLQRVHWLLPLGHATEPFQDEYISRCRQQLLNQIIQPSSHLHAAQAFAEYCKPVQPAGFIFHLSRCGSTLVSGCLSELESTCVFSESPLLTELLLDNKLSAPERKNYLRAFVDLQSAAYPQRPQMIIKWNAWDIFHWQLIRELYPQVPCVFLIRNPVEILASHQRLVGRHMSGDPTLAHLHSVFSVRADDLSMLDRQQQVLSVLLESISGVVSADDTFVMDYACLDIDCMEHICLLFHCDPSESDLIKIQARMLVHSKNPVQSFVADSAQKKQYFSSDKKSMIRDSLDDCYQPLLMGVHKPGNTYQYDV